MDTDDWAKKVFDWANSWVARCFSYNVQKRDTYTKGS
jgi:hypothetical protein